MSKRKKNKPDDIIAGRGSEREGACDGDSQYFTPDGSVEVVGGHDPDDCQCFDYCECDECERCTYCECHPEDCECDGCRICNRCDESLGNCNCEHDIAVSCLMGCHKYTPEQLVRKALVDDWDIDYANQEWIENGHSESYFNVICEQLVEEMESYSGGSVREYCDYFCSSCDDDVNNRFYTDCASGNGSAHYCSRECDCYCECSSGEGTDGELVSPVLRTQKDMIEWNEKNHPYETNSSCGHHEHRSTKLLAHHCVLAEKEFTTYLVKETYKWAEKNKINKGSALYERLKGNNHYCKMAYRFYEQVLDTDHYPDSRYCFVNYCWQKHSTMEIRLAPEFKKNELNVKWAVFVDEVVTNFINRHKNTVVDHNESVLF